jgi:hypothetical protein
MNENLVLVLNETLKVREFILRGLQINSSGNLINKCNVDIMLLLCVAQFLLISYSSFH